MHQCWRGFPGDTEGYPDKEGHAGAARAAIIAPINKMFHMHPKP